MAYYLEENEKWVKGFRGYYALSDMGECISYHYGIREVRTINHRALKNGSFGATVGCSYNGRSKTINVAVEMYEAFVRPLEDGEVLMPINGDATDLRLENMMPVNKVNALKMSKEHHPMVYALENLSTGVLVCYQGVDGAKEYGLNGVIVHSLIAQATADGKDYFSLPKADYRFIMDAA